MKTVFALLLVASAVGLAQKSAKDLYLDKCASCHAADGTASTAKGRKLKVKPVKQTAGKVSVEEMMKIVADGKAPDMDGYSKEFSKDQIKDLVEYYRSLAK